jgi:hypothetical protein
MELHVGRGTDRAALTVFPLWSADCGRTGYSATAANAVLGEQGGAPAVNSLVVKNAGARPLLLLEGQLLEGGWQHRMLTRSVLVPAGESMNLDVVCVEQGRWHGGAGHTPTGRRASMRVRNVDPDGPNAVDHQSEVWRRVAEQDARYGTNGTASLVEHVDRARDSVRELVEGLRPLPGQVGVLIGIAGQPVMAEVFDSPSTLRRQFRSIVEAAAFDAVGREPVRTPARRAIRFVERLSSVRRRPVAPAGLGTTVSGASPYASVTGLAWQRRLVHLRATNSRHALNVGRAG